MAISKGNIDVSKYTDTSYDHDELVCYEVTLQNEIIAIELNKMIKYQILLAPRVQCAYILRCQQIYENKIKIYTLLLQRLRTRAKKRNQGDNIENFVHVFVTKKKQSKSKDNAEHLHTTHLLFVCCSTGFDVNFQILMY